MRNGCFVTVFGKSRRVFLRVCTKFHFASYVLIRRPSLVSLCVRPFFPFLKPFGFPLRFSNNTSESVSESSLSVLRLTVKKRK